MQHGGIREYSNVGIREVCIPQLNSIVYNSGKIRMKCRLTIASKGNYIKAFTPANHFL